MSDELQKKAEETLAARAESNSDESKSDEGDEPSASSIKKMEAENKRKKELLDEQEELLKREAELQNRQALGGGSEAGNRPKEKTQEELDDIEAKERVTNFQ